MPVEVSPVHRAGIRTKSICALLSGTTLLLVDQVGEFVDHGRVVVLSNTATIVRRKRQ